MNANAETAEMNNVFHLHGENVLSEDLEDYIAPLLFSGGIIILPSKAGYIMVVANCRGFLRKFTIEGSPQRVASSAVLISSMEQLEELAVLDEKTRELQQKCREENVLLECFLPWKEGAIDQYIPDDGSVNFATNGNSTSCFVVNHGLHSEAVAKSLWDSNKILSFATSVNSHGAGNHKQVKRIDWDTVKSVDIFVEADEFMCRYPLGKYDYTRCEPGAIISMVNDNGQLADKPTIIREGQDMGKITQYLSGLYGPLD